ncbi:neprilysin-2-like isoform X2 [Photinus pyralis]|nr:neprilysin-2-like isoform X2 [Photinus pyralis]
MGSKDQEPVKPTSWWKRRTTTERWLALVSTIAVLIAVALVVVLVTSILTRIKSTGNLPVRTNRASTHDSNNVCMTAGCNRTAADVLSNMDPNIDPCDDFYKFACGNFIKRTKIPDDKSFVTSFNLLSDLLQVQLRTMIGEPVEPEEPGPFVQLKRLYSSCMNTTAIELDGLTTMKAVLQDLGGWPVIEGQWDQSKFEWTKSVYKFRKTGYSIDFFLKFSVSIDYKNSTLRVIQIDQAELLLAKEYFSKGLEDGLVRAYYDYMVDIAVMFGANREIAKSELKDSLDFEIQLSNISLSPEDRRNYSLLYNPMSVHDLQVKFPSIPWLEYLNSAMNIPSIPIKSSDVIIVSVPGYISKLEKLLSSTPKRIQANYVMWGAVYSSVTHLTDQLRQRQLQYTKLLNGRTELGPRWKECTDIVSNSLSVAVGALYIRKYFPKDAKQKAKEIASDIKEEFINILKEIDWMDNATRGYALEKAAAVTAHVAYPDELLSDKKLERVFEGLDLSSDKFLKVMLSLTLFGIDSAYKKFTEPVKKQDWMVIGRPAVVNAYYSTPHNSIQVPAGILQGVFFSNDRPQYMNYGGIGFAIGHEITHGFDDQGRQFDKDGNLVDWWAPSTKAAFMKKAQCIIDQYTNYTVPEVGLHVNGINTQGENIADNGGVKEAYLTYASWVKRHGSEPRLPGLDYTPEQMFWISTANVWCSLHRPEALKMRISTAFHAPDNFRVEGPLSNSPQFSKDFNCPINSKMNPIHKCSVW